MIVMMMIMMIMMITYLKSVSDMLLFIGIQEATIYWINGSAFEY